MKKTIFDLSNKLQLDKEVIEKIYKYYWVFIRQKIESLPLMEDLSDQEFDKLKKNFNIPNLGKLNCTKEKYKKLKIRDRYVKKNIKTKHNAEYKENQADGQLYSDN